MFEVTRQRQHYFLSLLFVKPPVLLSCTVTVAEIKPPETRHSLTELGETETVAWVKNQGANENSPDTSVRFWTVVCGYYQHMKLIHVEWRAKKRTFQTPVCEET